MGLQEFEFGDIYAPDNEFKYDVLLQIQKVLNHGSGLFDNSAELSDRERHFRELRQLKFLMKLAKTCEQEGRVKHFPAQKLIDLALVPESGERFVPRRIDVEDLEEEERDKAIIMLNTRNQVAVAVTNKTRGTEYRIRETYHAVTDVGRDINGKPINYVIGTIQKNLCLLDAGESIEQTLDTYRQDSRIIQRGRLFFPPTSEIAAKLMPIPVTERELARTAAVLSLAYAPTFPVRRLLQPVGIDQ